MPLTFDMSRDQLEHYAGTNPRPEDHDAYWQATMAELDALDADVVLEPADFQTGFATCSHLWFTGLGGARVHAKLIRPAAVARGESEPGPAVLLFHGYGGRAPDWTDILSHAAAGRTVAALDCRGQAGLSEDNLSVRGWTRTGHIIRGLEEDDPSQLYYRHVFADTALLARIVMGMDGVDPNRVGATGGSQGGALTIACAALEPRIALAAPVFPFLSDYKRVYDLDLCKDAYGEISEWFKKRDPLHSKESEVFTRLGYIDVQFLAPRIRATVLMATGFADMVCPPSTQFAAYNKITASKQLLVYPDHGHEGLPGVNDTIFTFLSDL